jgi:hypothetical protein
MIKIVVQLALVFAILGSAGCYRITYKLEEGNKVEDGSKVKEDPEDAYRTARWNNYFFFGLIPVNDQYDLASFCPDRRPVEVKTSMRPANVFSTIISLDLNTASTIEVMCMKETPQTSTFSDIKSKIKWPF